MLRAVSKKRKREDPLDPALTAVGGAGGGQEAKLASTSQQEEQHPQNFDGEELDI